MFCCTLLYVHSSIAIILMGKRELIALLNLTSWCLMMVEWLFLAVPRGCLQFVIVIFPDHTHLLFWWSTQSRLVTLLSSLIARRWVGLQTLWQFRFKDLSIDEMVGAWCFGCCQAYRGLPVGFLLRRYSVLLLLSPYLCFISFFISWFICSRRWCIDK